jgi:hypothetical protein
MPSQASAPQIRARKHRAVLADARGEREHVEPAEHGGQRADLAHDAPHVELERRARARIAVLDLEQGLRARREPETRAGRTRGTAGA